MHHFRALKAVIRTALPAVFLLGAAVANAASTGTQLLRVTGGSGLRANGDYVSAGTGTDDQYRFLVEVPPGTTTLTIDVFDADFGISAADEAADLDRQRGGFDSTVEYRVFDPSGTGQVERFNFGDDFSAVAGTPTGIRDTAGSGISCNATGPTVSAHANWCTLFTVASPAAGHWLVEVDTSQQTGDDVHAFGIRAHDGNIAGGPGGGVELNVYADSAVLVGVNQLAGAPSRSALFTLHPYAIRGCTTDMNDFDYDSGSALVVGGQQQQITLVNRPGTSTTTFLNASLSGNDAWNNNPVTTGSGSTSTRDGMGIWTMSARINEAAADNANYATLYLGDDVAATPAAGTTPANNPDPNTFRIYLPTDAGVAPVKPYLWQELFYASGQTPPAIGLTSTYSVNVRIVNPTAFPLTIDGTSAQSIRVRIPTDAGPDDVNFLAGSLAATQGTPTIAGSRNITWNPGTIAPGAEALMTYQVTVTPETATVNVTGAGNATAFGNTLGTRADFWDGTGPLVSGDESDIPFGGLCPLQVQTAIPVPTPVTLSWMKATRTGGALDVAWTTDSEYSSFGFDVYGRRNGAWVKLNAQIVPSHHDTAEPQDYTLRIENAADVDAVALEELGATGTKKRFATLPVDAELGSRITAAKIDWAAARAELDAGMAMHALTALDGPSGTSPRAYLDVDADGLWRVSVAQLASGGLDFSGVAVEELALTNDNMPVPIRIRNAAGATLGANAVIEFHGRARESLYGKRNAYLLEANVANARRVRETFGATAAWPQSLASYPHEVVRGNDSAYSFGSRSDPWYDTFQFTEFPNEGQRDYIVSVDAIAAGAGESVLVDVSGAADWPGVDNDQVLEVLVNGTSLGTSEFPGRERALLRFALPPGTLVAGSNTITLRQPVSHLGPGQYAGILVERLELQYARTFTAQGGTLAAQLGPSGDNEASNDLLFRDGVGDIPGACARGECAAIDTNGWASATLNAWVVGRDEHLVLADATPVGGSLRVLAPTGQFQMLVVSDEAGIGTPAVRVAVAPGEPALPGAELLIVSHPAFAGGLADFIAARSAEMSVRVVDTEQVYARYSSGQADPAAIQTLLREAYAQGTRYALLVGGDTYDYDNHSGTGAISYLPTIYTHTGEVVNYAPADSLYGDVDGDGATDIAIGRWPVRSAQQLAAVVQKTLAYASAAHAGQALFVASQPESGLDFTALSASLRAPLEAQGWTAQVVGAMGGTPDPQQATVLAALNDGRALTNFVGHSSIIRWQSSSDFNTTLLDGATAESSLTNAANPTIVAHWGCLAGWFVSISYNSMSQNFLLDLDGGAAAAIGAATLVDTPQQDEFIRIFLERAGTGTTRLGDALDQTRREFTNTFGTRRDLVYGTNLLGDPTLRVRR